MLFVIRNILFTSSIVMDLFILNELLDDDNTVLYSASLASSIAKMLEVDRNVVAAARITVEDTSSHVKNFYEMVIPYYSNDQFTEHFRMKRSTMQKLTGCLKEKVSFAKLQAMLIPFEKKIHVTVWILANQCSFREVANLFGIQKSSANYIFLEICRIIAECRTEFIKWPNYQQQQQISRFIETTYKFPNCVGLIDGCHIQIKAPSHNPTDFYNRKQTHSLVLQAVCDHTLKFTDIYIGHTGRAHDARIFRESPIGQNISDIISNDYHILGDSAYTLKTNLLTPFRDNSHLSDVERNYNKKHAAARSLIERSYAVLKNKFRRLKYLDMNKTEDISVVICAACVLHNFIIINEKQCNIEDNVDSISNNVEAPATLPRAERPDRAADAKRRFIAETLIL